jgi:hypothetical protein
MSSFSDLKILINDLADTLKKANDIFGSKFYTPHDGIGYQLEQLRCLPDALDEILPVKVGDKVFLTKKPNCENNWKSCSHFLIIGAVATVYSIDIHKGKFYVNLIFDKESWIDEKGIEHFESEENKHTFFIPMSFVVKITS